MSKVTPKIRISMPKWQAIRSASWAKELLMTFIGATLSIILTFGTAHFVDQKQQREDGRQMAMMVIHDMENTSDYFRTYSKEDEQAFNTVQYVLEHKKNLAEIPYDSLVAFVQYVTASSDQAYSYDDSSERTFFSSHEAWKTINNAAFIDQVQSFYHYRRQKYTLMQQDHIFQKPVSNKEYQQLLLQNYQILQDTTIFKHIVEKYLDRKDVDLYINFSFFRRKHFDLYIDFFRSVANRCKFMMDISDEELAQYVQNQQRTGKPLTEKKLIGKWQMETADDQFVEREYRNDHTYTSSTTQYIAYSYFTGRIIVKYTTYSTWELRGDSLYLQYNPEYTFEIDRSQIHYVPEMEESVNNLVEICEQNYTAWLEELKNQDVQRDTVYASINASGNKIEMRYKQGTVYFTRCDTP